MAKAWIVIAALLGASAVALGAYHAHGLEELLEKRGLSETDVAGKMGEADVAVMDWWDGRAGFTATAWVREPLVVIVPPEHPWAALETIETEQLLSESLLGGEASSGTGRVLRDQLGPIADRLRTRSGYGSTEAVKRAVCAGQGVSIVMRSAVADEVASGRLAALSISGAPLVKEIKLVVPDRLPHTSPAAILIENLTQRA